MSKSSHAARARRSRKVLPGFPRDEPFSTPEAIAEYFAGEKIICLRCGKGYRTLGIHLKRIHEMEPDEYREIYKLPWTHGLSCAETTELHSDFALEQIEAGVLVASPEQAALARESLKQQKPRQPFREVLTQRALDKMNEGKSGEYTKQMKLTRTKRGSPEFKKKMSELAKKRNSIGSLKHYWLGKKQTDEHILKRTGHKRRNQEHEIT